ncbi:hypothetical protein QWI17_09440 [Gilvimarinus sp. SDUM040013]|uniref:DUF4288 domain-containing protein n=1 Tax=Gilvimarinus gilvus TaxID=3058038 RepID=A0ABU4S036_9GAMM|nr:hypothetical protein [Gilvimarinus sp. SDUM040013]MDO3386059.1 hypothetical protein [Gilvimarinus sp. SDUM040013]MDX6850512.1 hypothetical protein [Gilvimarinus sp. SDUM040013]
MIYRAVVESFDPSGQFDQSGYVFLVASSKDEAQERLAAACTLWCDGREHDAYNLNSEHELMRDCIESAFEDSHLVGAGCRGQKITFAYPGRSDSEQLGIFLPPYHQQRLEAAFKKAQAYDRDWTENTENGEG